MALLGEFEVAARQLDPDREPDTFKFCGEIFTVSDQIGVIPLGRFAKAAVSGMDTAEMDGLAAMVDLLADAVIDEDRERLLETAARNRAQGEDLLPIVRAVIRSQTGRPTQQPSDSSDGLQPTGASSTASTPFGAVPPIQLDPRIRALQPVEDVALSLVV